MPIRLLFTFIFLTIPGGLTVSLFPQPHRLQPGGYFSRDDSTWYNRKVGITRFLIDIQDGAADRAIRQADAHEGDVEADFVPAVAYAHLGQGERAMAYLRASLRKELPPGRYLAGEPELFDFLAENGIGGVFLLSADRHRSDIWRIARTNGYPLYEFESSKLTNTHTHPVMPASVYGYNEKCSFGLLLFDTTGKEPWVEYRIVNSDNVEMKRFRLEARHLTAR